MFEKLVAERREANDATVIVGDPDIKILEDDIVDPLPRFLHCVEFGEIRHLRHRSKKDVRHGVGVGGGCTPNTHAHFVPDRPCARLELSAGDQLRVVELVLVDEHVRVRACRRHQVGVTDCLTDPSPR